MSILKFDSKVSTKNDYKTITVRILIVLLLLDALAWAGTILFAQPSTSSYSYSTDISISVRLGVMFWIFAGALITAVFGFRCLSKGERTSKILAIIGLISCGVAMLLQLLLVWGIIPFVEASGMMSVGVSAMGKFMFVATTTATAAILCALVAKINENGPLIAPLKYTALVCGICFWLATTLMIFVDASSFQTLFTKGLPLSGVLLAAFVVTGITAVLMSWFNRKDLIDELIAANAKVGEDYIGMDEIMKKSAEEKAKKEKELASREPLQDNNMIPTAVHDDEKIIAAPEENSVSFEKDKVAEMSPSQDDNISPNVTHNNSANINSMSAGENNTEAPGGSA